MLNERIELAEYICDIKPTMPQRLTYLNITNGLSGVPRALKVLARYALFDLALNHKQTADLLNLWCGFETDTMESSKEENPEFFEKVENWLPNYLEFLAVSDETRRESIEKAKKDLARRKKEWNSFTLDDEGEKNTENKISFLKILSDAYHEGKLKVRYLVLEEDPFLHVSAREDATQRKFLLKTAALYCAMSTESKKKVRIGYPELSNWIGSGCLQSKKVNKFLSGILYTKDKVSEKLFAKEAVDGNHNISKIIVSDRWLSETKAKIISEDDLVIYKENENVSIYKDRGCLYDLELIDM